MVSVIDISHAGDGTDAIIRSALKGPIGQLVSVWWCASTCRK